MKVLGVLVLAAIVLGAHAQTSSFCVELQEYLATTVSLTSCYYPLATIFAGLGSLVADPTLLTVKTFPDIVKNVTGYPLSTSTICGSGLCAANYTALVQKIYTMTDPSCALVGAGYDLVCVEDTKNDEFCGDLSLQTVCTEETSCCVGALSSFLTAAASVPSSPLAAYKDLAGGFAYEFYCALRGYSLTSPDLYECEFVDGTQVTNDYTWRANFDCNLDAVTDYFDTITATAPDGYTEDEVSACIESIKAITSTSAEYLFGLNSDSVSFSYVCESCTEIVDGVIAVLETQGKTYSSDDNDCSWAAKLLAGGCYHSDDQYCGDYFLGGFDDVCSATSTQGCCAVSAAEYLIDYLTENDLDASLVSAAISTAQSECSSLTSSQITGGISSCNLVNSLDATSTGAAAGITLRSIFTIVAASIAVAFMMFA